MKEMIRLPWGRRMRSWLPALLLLGCLLSAGCVGPFEPVPPSVTPVPTTSAIPTPLVTASPEQTPVQPLRNIPADLPSSGFIERSYGYVPYSPPPEYRLTMIDSNSRRDAAGNLVISGRVKNEGPGSLSYLQITFSLFDSSGNLVGNAHTHVEYFGSGKIWRFETDPVPGTNFQYFEIAGIMAQ